LGFGTLVNAQISMGNHRIRLHHLSQKNVFHY
jgi:hypothetical protein